MKNSLIVPTAPNRTGRGIPAGGPRRPRSWREPRRSPRIATTTHSFRYPCSRCSSGCTSRRSRPRGRDGRGGGQRHPDGHLRAGRVVAPTGPTVASRRLLQKPDLMPQDSARFAQAIGRFDAMNAETPVGSSWTASSDRSSSSIPSGLDLYENLSRLSSGRVVMVWLQPGSTSEPKQPIHLDDDGAVAELGEPVGHEGVGVAVLVVHHKQLAPWAVLPPQP